MKEQDLQVEVDRTGLDVRVRVTHLPTGASVEASGRTGEVRLREAALCAVRELIDAEPCGQ
jgi:hypothetical protein